jgi:hypothetical protein
VNWNGQGLKRTRWTVPMYYDTDYHLTSVGAEFTVSPDGRFLAFNTSQVLEENISMIQNVR